MTRNLDDDVALEKTFRDASKAFTPPVGLKEGMRASLLVSEAKADSRNAPGAGISMAKRSRTWLWRCAAAAAAACVLVGLAVWVIQRADKGEVRIRQEHETISNVVVLVPRVAAKPADLPPADFLVYFRAWEKSPDALDELLTRDAAVLLRPEPIDTALDARKFLRTMNPTKEEHDEKHSMRGVASGALV
jgi:hypothetical protein